MLALKAADCTRACFDQDLRDAIAVGAAGHVFADVETASAFLEKIFCTDFIVKLETVDDASAIAFPLNTAATDSHPVVDVRVALGVDDRQVHREPRFVVPAVWRLSTARLDPQVSGCNSGTRTASVRKKKSCHQPDVFSSE